MRDTRMRQRHWTVSVDHVRRIRAHARSNGFDRIYSTPEIGRVLFPSLVFRGEKAAATVMARMVLGEMCDKGIAVRLERGGRTIGWRICDPTQCASARAAQC